MIELRIIVMYIPLSGFRCHGANLLLRYVGPVSDKSNHTLSVEQTEAEARVDLESPLVGGPAVVMGKGSPLTGPHNSVLHVPPRQVGAITHADRGEDV